MLGKDQHVAEIVRDASLEKVNCSLIMKGAAIRDHGNRRRVSEQGPCGKKQQKLNNSMAGVNILFY